jgi:hypothetical protein
MKRTEAIEKAKVIAKLIKKGVAKLRRTPINNLPILAMLPWLKASSDIESGEDSDFDCLVPEVFEIFIFGSVAGKKDEVGDIDILILDNGFFSKFFNRGYEKGKDQYEELSENLNLLLTGWLGYKESKVSDIINVDTDLQILPFEMLKSEKLRSDIASRHSDPFFLQNAFSTLLRFDGGELIPVDIAYLEEKHAVNLSDLKS